MFSLGGLLLSLMFRFNLINYKDATIQVATGGRKHTISAIGFLLALLGSTSISINNVGHYFCLTPTDVIIRSGYLGAQGHLTWDDLRIVRARCEILRRRGRAPYPAGVLDLMFSDGEEVHFGLDSVRDLLNLGETLRHTHYHYEMGASVEPAQCPTAFYSLLRNWPGG
jgi:hypothetical protein